MEFLLDVLCTTAVDIIRSGEVAVKVSIIGPIYEIAICLTMQLQPKIGNADSFIRDSGHFLERIRNRSFAPDGILVSFVLASLFSMMPVGQTTAYKGSISCRHYNTI